MFSHYILPDKPIQILLAIDRLLINKCQNVLNWCYIKCQSSQVPGLVSRISIQSHADTSIGTLVWSVVPTNSKLFYSVSLTDIGTFIKLIHLQQIINFKFKSFLPHNITSILPRFVRKLQHTPMHCLITNQLVCISIQYNTIQ